ncbi:DUF3017 domain-containing protein [Actinomyces sp. B33]|uniref:DUF3017 domain-containing protein n=1 Tax=Actinomyces sp. B33 TaxID=2942131 RepID=UPI00233FFC17|nr:DUF3017 domain-containing protein [Actinomyces sp. B33]MDC4233668.1 DUF3017 domain-containing protein [Actinomyces sp. B33]
MLHPDDPSARGRAAGLVALAAALGGLGVLVGLIATDHPHRAVHVLVAVLALLALLRLWIPGRPWFSSRNRWADAAVLGGVALAIWYLAPFTATVGIG